MGCFNLSCFASLQIIAPKDPCYVIPIVRQASFTPLTLDWQGASFEVHGHSSSNCYADGLWKPITHPIQATYDDYGNVKLCLNEDTQVALVTFFNALLKSAPVTQQGSNEFHDLPFNFSEELEKMPALASLLQLQSYEGVDLTKVDKELVALWAYAYKLACKGRVFLKAQGSFQPVSFAVLHGETYRALAAAWEAETEMPLHHKAKKHLQAITAALTKFDKLLASATKDVEADQQPPIADITALKVFMASQEVLQQSECSSSLLTSSTNSRLIRIIHNVATAQASAEQTLKQLEGVLKHSAALSMMDLLNVRIIPMSVAAQDYENELGHCYREFIDAVSTKVTAARNK